MKLLMIGGSNTVMKPGYLNHAAAWFREKGHEIPKVRNLSVGANNCLIGLENLRMAGSFETFDRIVVEFAINDMSLASPVGFETWQCAYEGLLRHILKNNSRAQVHHLLLGRRAERNRTLTDALRTGMKEIIGHYSRCRDVRLLDFDRYFREKLGNDQTRIEEHYKDDVHYRVENGARLLGRYLAWNLMAKPLPVVASALPAPLRAEAFDRAEFHSLPDSAEGLELREFSNTRFTRWARALRPGEPLIVELPGPLIGLSFQATVDSRPLLVEEEGEPPVLLYTSHSELRQTPDKFRIKNFIFDWKKWAAMSRKGPRRVVLTALENGEHPRFRRFLVERYHMVPGWGEGSGPYVSNLLYLPPAPEAAETPPTVLASPAEA